MDASVPRWFRLWGNRRVDRYVGVYEKLAAWATRAGVPAGRVCWIGNALDLDRFSRADPLDVRAEFGLPNDKLVGVTVCGIRPEKGIDTLLEAVAGMHSRGRAVFLVIGKPNDPAYYQACLRMRARLGLDEEVRFVSERHDVPRILLGSDFAVLPSRSESGPLVLAEYAASGLPFVATSVGDLSARAADAGLREFVGPGDATALGGAIDRLLTLSDSERRERGRHGKDAAFELFDIRQVMPRWCGLYEAVSADSGRRAQ